MGGRRGLTEIPQQKVSENGQEVESASVFESTLYTKCSFLYPVRISKMSKWMGIEFD